MVANTPNGRVPHIGGGVALLPLGPNGEKWGVDDLLAEGYNWGDIQAFIYPMNQVFDVKTGKFSPAPGLLPPVSHSGFETGGNHLPLLTVAEFFAQATESYDWLVEGFIARGAITKLAGKAKYSGKTTLLMHLVASVLLGTPFLGMPTTQGKVLFLSEQGNNLKVALESAGIDEHTGGLKLLLKRSVFDVSWENLMGLVLSACKEEEIDLAIVDTLVDFSDVEGDEENSSGKVKATMKALKRLKDSGIGVCFTQHHNIHGRGRGSTQFEGEVDIVLDLHRLSDKSEDGPEDSDNTVRLLEGIGRGVEHKLYIRLGDDGYEAMNVTEDRLKIGKNGRLVLRFLPVLKAEAKTIPEVKSALEEATHHMSETTIRRELKKLEDEDLAHKTGEGTKGDPVRFWRSEPKKEETETQEPEGTNLLPPVSHPIVETGDNHFGSEKVTPIRPGIEVSEEPPAPKAKERRRRIRRKRPKGLRRRHLQGNWPKRSTATSTPRSG